MKTIKNGGGKKLESSHCSKGTQSFFKRLESVLHIETKCNDLISIHCLVSVVEFVYPQGTKVIQKRDVIFLFVSLLNPWLTDSPKYQSSVDLIPWLDNGH